MKNQSKNFDFPIQTPGFGRFPYVIVRMFSAMYMQIPIHLFGKVEKQDVKEYPGFHAYGYSPDVLNLPLRKRMQTLQQDLLNMATDMRDKIKSDRGINPRMCLVLDTDWCFYFTDDEIQESQSIPSGGTLFSQTHAFLAMNTPHFLPNQE